MRIFIQIVPKFSGLPAENASLSKCPVVCTNTQGNRNIVNVAILARVATSAGQFGKN
jgi:hypothetical protein